MSVKEKTERIPIISNAIRLNQAWESILHDIYDPQRASKRPSRLIGSNQRSCRMGYATKEIATY